MSTDPVIRYAAGTVLVLAFAAALVVAVHGYWVEGSAYVLPNMVSGIILLALGSASTLLGVHVGTIGTTSAVQKGADVARNGVNGRP